MTAETPKSIRSYWRIFLADRDYFRQIVRFALPLTLQNTIMASLNMVSVVFVGQLGDAPVAAIGLANQIFFLLQLVLFGINSGSAMFTAQLWGKQDIPNIRRVLALALLLGCTAALFFLGLTQVAPQLVLGVYSKDPAVVALGSEYLRIFGWSYFFVAITFGFAMVLRSTGDVKTPTLVSTSALLLNTLLSYSLIFGKFGLPALGLEGAAIAGLTTRLLECSALLFIVYRRGTAIALRLKDLLGLDLAFIGTIFRPILPVILNETFWALGTTAYSVVYARMGTESIAAMNIVGTIDNLAFVFIFGLSNATAIMVGNRIGAGEERRAFQYAGRSLALGVLSGLVIGCLVLIWSPFILGLYQVSPIVIESARKVLVILSCLSWMRAANIIIVVGILRSGGDTIYSFFLDGLIIWLVGVPMAFFTAFVLELPVYWVYLAIMSDELLKCILGLRRYLTRKWIHNLARRV